MVYLHFDGFHLVGDEVGMAAPLFNEFNDVGYAGVRRHFG